MHGHASRMTGVRASIARTYDEVLKQNTIVLHNRHETKHAAGQRIIGGEAGHSGSNDRLELGKRDRAGNLGTVAA